MTSTDAREIATFSLNARAWRGLFAFSLIAALGYLLLGGIEVYRDGTDWSGWLEMLLGAFWLGHALYLRRRGYFRLDNRLVLTTERIEILAAEMTAPQRIPIASLRRVRAAAGNLYLDLTDREPIQLAIGWLPYRRVQRIKAALREWGQSTGVEVLV